MPRDNQIAVQQAAGMVQAGLAAGLQDDTALDESARLLRKKVYEKAGASFDALLELLGSEKVAVRTRVATHALLLKLAFQDMHDVAKLRLERERMLLEAQSAERDREAKERIAERDASRGGAGAQIIVLDSEAVARVRLAASEQERLRDTRPKPNGKARTT